MYQIFEPRKTGSLDPEQPLLEIARVVAPAASALYPVGWSVMGDVWKAAVHLVDGGTLEREVAVAEPASARRPHGAAVGACPFPGDAR